MNSYPIMATHSRTYVKRYVVLDKELEIRILKRGAISGFIYEVGRRIDLDKIPHRFSDGGNLILNFDGVEHLMSKDAYHLDVVTETIDT